MNAPESTPLSRVSAELERVRDQFERFAVHESPRIALADAQALVDEVVLTRSRVVSALDLTELADIARETFELADGDSNDDEIEGLQRFRDEALRVLRIAVDHD